MRQILQMLICLTSITGVYCLNAQCPEGEWGQISFATQAEVDNFIVQYPNCTEIDKKLIIGTAVGGGTNSSNISNLSPFSNLTSIKDLVIQNNEPLTSLNGLHNLASINGILNILWNNNLTNIEALSNIQSVKALNVDNNDRLPNLNGLQNISQVTGNVVISQNDLLTNLEGLTSLTNVGETFEVWTNSNLTSLEGVENLIQVNGWRIVINDNQNLQSLNGLNGLAQIPNGNLEIFDNQNLTDLQSLSNLTSINELKIYNNNLLQTLSGLDNIETMSNLILTNNPNLQICSTPSICDYLGNGGISTINGNSIGCSSGTEIQQFCEGFSECPQGDVVLETQHDVDLFLLQYPDCTLIQGNLSIGVGTGNSDISDLEGLQNIEKISGKLSISNTSLTDLSGLNSLTQIGSDLIIKNNMDLENLSALTSLTSINGSAIIIENNNALMSLSGLDNINPESIVNLILQSSSSLSTCNINSICMYVSTFGSVYTISGNAHGCNSFEEVLDACQDILPECPSGGEITFTSQEQLEHFLIQYPNCTEITGALNINGINSNITDLTPLSNITKTGAINIFQTSITNLYGLHNLTISGGTTGISFNNNLINLDELSNLETISGVLFITDNSQLNSIEALSNITELIGLDIRNLPSLTSLYGLHNLASVEWDSSGDVSITGENGFTTLEGLNSLTLINGSLTLQNLPNLTSLEGLNNLQAVAEIRIQNNPLLNSISALENLDDNDTNYEGISVGGIHISKNASLESLHGLHNLTTTGDLLIENCNSLTNLSGLDSLETIGSVALMFGSLQILNNSSLVDLSGLANLTAIGGGLNIQDNEALENMNTLSNLTHTGYWDISRNPSLMTLSGMDNIEISAYIKLSDNNNLSTCSLSNLCTYLSNGGVNQIYDNATGCNSAQEILDLCELRIEEISDLEEISFYPVPIKQILNIVSKSASQIELVRIFDLSGKEVFTSKGNNAKLDISVLPAGTYVVSVKTIKGVHNEKIMKR